MLILLPPSETKRDGGDQSSVLDLGRLSFPGLTRQRRATLSALRSLGRNQKSMADALGLGPTQKFEIARNRAVRLSPVMPAIDRYTGVLFDALDAATFGAAEREYARTSLFIHSALFGLIGAADPIPAYRLSHNSKLPGIRLKLLWRDAISAELGRHDGFVLDLRSEAYLALGPAPKGSNASYVRVVSVSGDGTARALNHFNKQGKGTLARAIVASGVEHPHAESLLEWAATEGIALVPGVDGELSLIV